MHFFLAKIPFSCYLCKKLKKTAKMTRGIRNNNPLNIRHGRTNWIGAALVQTDREFVQFISMYYGWRAALRVVRTYQKKYRIFTPEAIIRRWAPAADGNDPDSYTRRVCRITGLGGRENLSPSDPRIEDLVLAMARIESGDAILDYRDSLHAAFLDQRPSNNPGAPQS